MDNNLPEVLPQSLPQLTDRELILLTLQSVSTNHTTEIKQIERLEKIIEDQGIQVTNLQLVLAQANLPKLRATVDSEELRFNRAATIIWTISIILGGLSVILGIIYHTRILAQ